MNTWSDLFMQGEPVDGYKPLFLDDEGNLKAIDEAGLVDDTVTPNTVVSSQIRTIVELLQSEYDALETPDPETLYIIRENQL